MTKPSDFILTTDYATLKNDGAVIGQVTMPGSQTIPGSSGASYEYIERHTDVVVGATGSINRLQISSSKNSNIVYSGTFTFYSRSGVFSGFTASYTITAFIYRLNATTVRFQVIMENPYNGSLLTEAGDETFTFRLSTFIPPFA